MEQQDFKSPISYSVQNEDYRTEQAVLQNLKRNTGTRLLMVASSGENVLSLLANERIASIEAVDLNPAQIDLCELRQVAAEHLLLDEQFTFLGCDPRQVGSTGAFERLALLDRILPHLSASVRRNWEARRETDIAFGVHHVGRNDNAMRDIVVHLHQAGFDPLQQTLNESQLNAWTQVYADVFTPDYIRDTFGIASEGLARRIAGISAYLGECHFRAIQKSDAKQNYFVTTAFASRYATEAGNEGYPLYLQEIGQQALRKLGTHNRLFLTVGNLLEQMPKLATERGLFDLISISNIADWMSEDEFRAVIFSAAQCLNPGGALLARTATGRPMIANIMGQYMRADNDFNMELTQTERGPWFRVIAAGFND